MQNQDSGERTHDNYLLQTSAHIAAIRVKE